MKTYLFDTSVWRDIGDGMLGRGTFDPAVGERVRSILYERGDRIVASVETVYELVAHVRAEEMENYPYIHSAICAVVDYTDGQIVDHADYVLQRSLLGKPRHQSVVTGARDLVKTIRNIERFADLSSIRHYVRMPGGIVYYSLLSHLQRMTREELRPRADEWADRMIATAELTFWPTYRADLASGGVVGIADEVERCKALRILESPAMLVVLMTGIALRVGVASTASQHTLDTLSNGLCAFYCVYKAIWRRAVETGYNFLKPENLNDLVDMLLLMHLIEDDVILVTNDNRLFKAVKDTCKQHGRVTTFARLAASLGVA